MAADQPIVAPVPLALAVASIGGRHLVLVARPPAFGGEPFGPPMIEHWLLSVDSSGARVEQELRLPDVRFVRLVPERNAAFALIGQIVLRMPLRRVVP